MGFPRVERRRRTYAYLLARSSVPYRTIQKKDRERYGTCNGTLALSTISQIKAIGDLTGDPNFRSPAYREGKTLTYEHKRLILDALVRCCTTSTAELERKLLEVEVTVRTRFAHSTINAAIREANWTLKRVTLYNARRCPVECATASYALTCYDIRRVECAPCPVSCASVQQPGGEILST